MKKTDAIIIMDGFGWRKEEKGNAVIAAGTPYIKSLMAKYPYTFIEASGRAVGLPAGQMGNSEVGHLNLGAGRVVYQDITRIDKAIEDGDFFANPAFVGAIENVKKHGTALHLVGLLSDGGVHSCISHMFALLELAKRNDVKTVYVHCVTDGRDVPPDSAVKYIAETEAEIKKLGVGRIATVEGRYYYMDRDNRWERVKKGYDGVFAGVGAHYATAEEGVRASYDKKVYDEFIEPIVVGDYDGVKANDSIIFYNFRSDRAREITRAAIYEDFDCFERTGGYKPVYYVGMTQYDATFTGIHTAFGPKHLDNTLGEYLAKKGLTQARVAETEKYAHVTFFFNGGEERTFPGEDRILVPSPSAEEVPTFDLKPEMSAYEVTDAVLPCINEDKYDVIILNFANCDMVGHTGVMAAAMKAVKTVDECVAKIVDAIVAHGGKCIITADHGNADQMIDPVHGGPFTAHTTNLVPVIVVDPEHPQQPLRDGGRLCDLCPTMLDMMGLPKPAEMTGESLIKH